MKLKNRKWLRFLVAVLLCGLLLTGTLLTGITAYGFDDYRVTTSNDFIITVPQKKYSGSSTEDSIRYKTQGWYLFKEKTKALDDESVDSYSHGFKLSSEFGDKTEPNSAGVYYQDFVTDADEIVKKMLEWYSVEQLAGGVTVYACRAITVYKTVSGTQKTVGTYYNYPDLVEVAGWSGGTKRAFKESYDIEIGITFGSTGFSIRVVDENGEEPDGYSNTYDVDGTILYGQTLGSISYPGAITGYDYVGYEWSNGSGYSKTGTGMSTGKYVVDYDNIGENTLVLTFRYQSKAVSAPTAIPTIALGTTITVTPTPTITPTPKPATPTPSPTPSDEWTEEEDFAHYYFTTDKGYNIDDIASSTTYTILEDDGTSWGTLADCEATKRTSGYLIGTDENGNKWHFIASGTNAIYVHPSVYKGYDVNTTDIQYITELTFPTTITCSGTTYTVVSIGGGTSKYRPEADVDVKDTTTTEEWYDDRIFWGEYVYSYYKDSSYPYYDNNHRVEYFYGVIGNGHFVNAASEYKKNSAGGGYDNAYEREYHVYNTTLKEVTIPDTVTEILPYAFMYCQALTTIHGGESLTEIGNLYYGSSVGTGYAFAGATHKVAELSEEGTGVTYGGDEYTWTFCYYYNESYSLTGKTAEMLAWEDAVRFKEYMAFPELPSLKVLGDYSFAYHDNMINIITLPGRLTTVRAGAFMGCGLDAITVPENVTSILGGTYTLGTKGRVKDKTVIFSEPEAQGTKYGAQNKAYYTVKAGYPVTYQPNGGTGNEQTFKSEITYNTQDVAFTGNNIYVTSDGNVYSAGATGTPVALGNTAVPKEVIHQLYGTVNGTSTAQPAFFYYDKSGELWYFGQYGSHTESGKNVYHYYSLPFGLEGEIAQVVQFVPGYSGDTASRPGLVYLTTDGHLYETYYSLDSSKTQEEYTQTQVTNALLPEMTFTHAWGDIYDSYGFLELIGTDGKAYYIDLESYSLSADNLEESTLPMEGTASWEQDTTISYNTVYLYTMQDGSLTLKYGSKTLALMAGSAPMTKDALIEWKVCSIPSSTSGSATLCAYFYLADGTLWFMDLTAMTAPVCMTGSGVTLTKCILRGYDTNKPYGQVLALDTQGRLWSAGYNYLGSLGNASTAGVQYPAKSAYSTLVNVSNGQTYQDITLDMFLGQAIGTDGNIYFASTHASHDGNPASKKFTLGADFSSGLYNSTCVYGFVERNRTTATVAYTDMGYLYHNEGTYLEVAFDLGYYFVADIYRNEWFAKNGYVFKEWNTAANGNGTEYLPGDKATMTQAMSLYAQWEKDRVKIRYHANGGNGNMADTILADDVMAAYLSKNKFTRTDYEFDGWNTKADGTGTAYADGAYVTGITGYLDLYAQWKEKIVNYTLVYMKYPYGTPSNTIWQQIGMTNSVSNTSTEIIAGAPYVATGYTVTYDTNKTAGMSTTPVMGMLTTSNTTTEAPSFNKWRLYETDNSGNHVYYGVQYAPGVVVSRMTDTDGAVLYLYPSWSGLGASVLLPNATCKGYTLKGWCESPDGTGEIYLPDDPDSDEASLYTPTKDTTLYAVWEADGTERDGFKIIASNAKDAQKELNKGNQALILNKGYGFTYQIETTRQDIDSVRIIPRYEWITPDGSEREEASIFYHAVKDGKRYFFLEAGSSEDTRNGQKNGEIILTYSQLIRTNVENENIWEYEFSLPSDTYAVPKHKKNQFMVYTQIEPLTGAEGFFETQGYLLVSFDIMFQSRNKQYQFDNWNETELAADMIESGWEYQQGNIIRYDLSKSIADDYEVGGVE